MCIVIRINIAVLGIGARYEKMFLSLNINSKNLSLHCWQAVSDSIYFYVVIYLMLPSVQRICNTTKILM